MSDLESYNSTSADQATTPQRPDHVLNDHRQQRENLPPPDEEATLDSQARAGSFGGASAIAGAVPNARPRRHHETPRVRRNTRSQLVSEAVSAEDAAYLMRRASRHSRNSIDRQQEGLANLGRQGTNDTFASSMHGHQFSKRERRPSKGSVDSDADSHASRSSQETEEDVCFPMLREHVRVNGIDFDEIEEFIKEERENAEQVKQQEKIIAQNIGWSPLTPAATSTANSFSERPLSKTAVKYTPKHVLARMKGRVDASGSSEKSTSVRGITTDAGRHNSDSSESAFYEKKNSEDDDSFVVKFGGAKINEDDDLGLPERYSFFHSDNEETVHAPDIPSLVEPGQTVQELFKNGDGTWWLDVTCPTDAEVKTLAKAFGIHPLTAEDIRMQETREKVELFRSYYFVCFHTFEPDKESEDYLEPINFYIVVFKEGVLTFHFAPVPHPANVRRRVRQLREYVDVNADWLCYAMIDDITDGFAPVIMGIEYEADAIEDSVLTAREMNFSSMLRKIGEARRKVMTLMRLLSNKADVIKMFAKRCQDENHYGPRTYEEFSPPPISGNESSHNSDINQQRGKVAQPRADIALYLGDIQDHVLTMYQNLGAYEKIFSRSHSNYLAQLQVESFNANLRVTEILGGVTLLGTLILPMNLVFSAFGMNVQVPGQDVPGLGWFFGIVGVLFSVVASLVCFVKVYLTRRERQIIRQEDEKRSIRSLGMRIKSRSREAAKSIISFPKGYD